MGNDILQAFPVLENDIPADQFLVQDFWVPLGWACAVLIPLAVLTAWWMFRRRKRTTVSGITPLQEALNELKELDAQLPPMRECSLRLSMILRSFLAGQTQDSALYETHEEFSQRIDSLASVPMSCQLETRDMLEMLAEFKYAGDMEHDPTRAHVLIEQARELVCRISKAYLEEQKKKEEVRA